MPQSIYEIAATRGITTQDYLRRAARRKPDDVVMAAIYADRFDIVEDIKEHQIYGKLATDQLNIKRLMDESNKRWEEHVAKYPPIFQEMRVILKDTRKIGYYDVSYPSRWAAYAGLTGEHFAISGDGLLMFMFEIVTLEGRGHFRLIPNHPDPNRPESKNLPENRELTAFRVAGNHHFGEVLTGDEVIATLKKVYHA